MTSALQRVCAACLMIVCASAEAAAGAAQFPSRPLRLIVAVPPGGAADFTARVVAQKMSEGLGQNVVVENRGGAGGTIASDISAKSSPDGYTLLLSSVTTHGVGPLLYATLRRRCSDRSRPAGCACSRRRTPNAWISSPTHRRWRSLESGAWKA